MKLHTRNYLDFFSFQIPEDCVCEIPGCGRPGNDIHHVQARGMGGNPKGDKDHISNLMALCREHHVAFGDVPGKREWLRKVHFKYMEDYGTARKNVGTPIEIVTIINKKR